MVVSSLHGIQSQKVDPLPLPSDVTPISPPLLSAMALQMLNPNPVPCTKSFSFTKRSNTFF